MYPLSDIYNYINIFHSTLKTLKINILINIYIFITKYLEKSINNVKIII